MALYGKTAGGNYRIVRTTDTGATDPATGTGVLSSAFFAYESQSIQADGTWPSTVATYDLTVKAGNPVRSTFNSKNVVLFDEASGLRTASAGPLITTGTIMAVSKLDNATTPGAYIFDGRGPSYQRWLGGKRLNYADHWMWAGDAANAPAITPASLTAPVVSAYRFDASDPKIWVGSLTATVPSMSPMYPLAPLTMGTNYLFAVDGQFNFHGWIGALYVWDTALSDTDIESGKAQLEGDWGV